MSNDTLSRFKLLLSGLDAKDDLNSKDMAYFWLIQNQLRGNVCTAAIIAINCMLARRFMLPQFGVIVTGFWRKRTIDLLPALLYLNFEWSYRMVEIAPLVDHLGRDDLSSDEGYLTAMERTAREKELHKKYLKESQYWH